MAKIGVPLSKLPTLSSEYNQWTNKTLTVKHKTSNATNVNVSFERSFERSLNDHLRDLPWEDIFKFSASAAASEFCEWVQTGIEE